MQFRGGLEIIKADLKDQVKEPNSLKVIPLFGSALCGKRSLAISVMQEVSAPFEVVSLLEISADGGKSFVRKLNSLGTAILTEFDYLPRYSQNVLEDYVMTMKSHETTNSRIWIMTSTKAIAIAESKIRVLDLTEDTATQQAMCNELIGTFPLSSECPITEIIYQATRELSLGQLVSVLNHARISALEKSEELQCHHLAKSFHALVLPCPSINITKPPIDGHICDFIFSSNITTQSVERFLEIEPAHLETIQEFISPASSDRQMLIIDGPVGSGKSFLANAIAYSPSHPFVTVTSADILRARIGDTEKRLWKVLSSNRTVVIEDIDKLFPLRQGGEESEETSHTGSVERCLPVLLSFLDQCPQKTRVIGTTRNIQQVTRRLCENEKIAKISLNGKLRFETKIALIKSQDPLFNETNVSAFDLINVTNRSQCIQWAREGKMARLRKVITI